MRDSSRNKMRLPDRRDRDKEKLVDRLRRIVKHKPRDQSKVRTK